MSLSAGQPAPAFTLKCKGPDGLSEHSLADHQGKDQVVLLFVPLAFTGVCTTELCDVSAGINAYKDLGAVVYGISVDSPFAQEAWAEKAGITIPLLSDFNREVSRAYGVLAEPFLPGKLDFQGVSHRSAFVINREGVITFASSNEDPHVLPDFEAIRSALAGS